MGWWPGAHPERKDNPMQKLSSLDEPFGAVPKRLAEALFVGELTWDEFAVLAWLELNINYRVSPPIWRGTTRAMAEAMRWPHSAGHLRKVIRGLHVAGWIESTARPRSPKPYTIRLLRGATRRRDCGQTAAGSGLVRPQSRDPWPQSEGDTNPHGERAGEPDDNAAGRSPQKQNSESNEVMSVELNSHNSSSGVGGQHHQSPLSRAPEGSSESWEAERPASPETRP
jgi:hypothetical protein